MPFDATSSSDGRRGRLLRAGLILVCTAIAYAPALRSGFVWDDDEHVTHNAALRSLDGLRRIWLEPGATPQYYPLTFTSFWIEWQLWADRPAGYHAVNVALHAVNGLLLWRVLARIGVPGAWLAGLIFALHPTHVESVAWITERKNTLSGSLFLLSALTWYDRADGERGSASAPRPLGRSVAAILLYAAALLAKTATLFLPLALLLVEWWRSGRIPRRDWRSVLPFLMLGGLAAAMTIWMEHGPVGAAGYEWSLTPFQRIDLAGRSLLHYIGTTLVPIRPSFVYPKPDLTSAPVGWLTWGALILLCIWLGRRSDRSIARAFLLALAYFVVSLLPVLGFVDFYYMRYATVADHFAYLPSLSLIALIAAGVARGCRISGSGKPADRAEGLIAIALAAVLGTLVFRQSRWYHDRETLWTRTLERNPGCWLAFSDLGHAHHIRGRLPAAADMYRRSIEHNPRDARTRKNLADALVAMGSVDEAVQVMRSGVALAPQDPMMHFCRADLLEQLGREGAIDAYREAVRLSPRFAEAWNNLGTALLRAGRPAEAIDALRTCVAVRPALFEGWFQLAVACELLERFNESERAYRAALRLRPDHIEARLGLANAVAQQGRAIEAAAEYERVLNIDPRNDEAIAARRRLLGSSKAP